MFDEAVEVLYPAQPLTLRDELKGMVTRIFPGGCTNLSGGLLAGYGGVVEVLEPESLRDAVAEAGRRMAAIYSPK